MKNRSERCPACGRKHKRSGEANRYYWLLLHAIADKVKPNGEQYSVETWHHWAKMKFIGAEEIKMPNGKTLVLPHSSADLDKGEFHEYVTQLEQWAAEHDVYLADMELA